MNPKYHIYIISKGRHESRLTSKTLEYMKVPYKIVIEPQEYDLYASVIDPKKILILPLSGIYVYNLLYLFYFSYNMAKKSKIKEFKCS